MLDETSKTIRLAVPIILGEIAQMALHLIDTAMVGAVSYVQLAAASLVFNVMNIPFVIGIGITISVSQMVSMAQGQFDGQKVSHFFFNGFVLCTITALVIAAGLLSSSYLFPYLGQDPQVVEHAIPFMRFIGISIIPMILFMTLKQFTDGLEHTKTAMMISLLGLPLNILLNWLLIFGNLGFPRLELIGAGWATLITRTLMFLALGFVVMKHHLFHRYIAVSKNQWKLKGRTIRELLHIGVPSSLQLGMESGVFAVSGIIIGTIGAVEQAAHQIALSCASLTFMVSLGLSQAASIRVSNAFGAQNFPKIKLIGKSTLVTALCYGTLCAILFTVFRHQLPGFFNDDPRVIEMASYLLIFAAIFQISDSTQAVGAGILRGLKDVKVPTLFIGIAYWVIGLPVGYLLTFHFNWGPSGIWTGLTTGLSMASIFLISRFFILSRRP